MKHLELVVKNTPLRVVISTLFSVFHLHGDETPSLMLDILHKNSRQAMGRAQ